VRRERRLKLTESGVSHPGNESKVRQDRDDGGITTAATAKHPAEGEDEVRARGARPERRHHRPLDEHALPTASLFVRSSPARQLLIAGPDDARTGRGRPALRAGMDLGFHRP